MLLLGQPDVGVDFSAYFKEAEKAVGCVGRVSGPGYVVLQAHAALELRGRFDDGFECLDDAE